LNSSGRVDTINFLVDPL